MTDTARQQMILVVDDEPQVLLLVDDLLSGEFQVKVALNGARGMRIAESTPKPDLILLDVMMDDVDGFEICKRLKANPSTWDIPVIFLTGSHSLYDEKLGLSLGAIDYISKPINPPILAARVKAHLALKASADLLRDRNSYLEQEVARRTEEARHRAEEARVTQELTMVALASIAETRDNETGNHILRTQGYVRALADWASRHPKYAGQLTPEIIERMFKAAPLHDIGKVGIPDRILLKPGKLTREEFEIMKKHAWLGYDAIEKAQQRVGRHNAQLELAKEIALNHHEKWDGSGYPSGLAGDAIPLSARIMAIADVFDALISARIYKRAMPYDQALAIMRDGRGVHFDPDLLDGFLSIQDQFIALAERYKDDELATPSNMMLHAQEPLSEGAP